MSYSLDRLYIRDAANDSIGKGFAWPLHSLHEMSFVRSSAFRRPLVPAKAGTTNGRCMVLMHES
jgi:hypothetical protein